MKNILTIDVEDWYQSSLELLGASKADSAHPTERVVRQIARVLALLDQYGAKATFFVLGTVAERFPQLVLDIAEKAHEIGCHGYAHRLVYRQTPQEFAEDVGRCMSLLTAITGQDIVSYRAPYFSITRESLWAWDVLAGLGIKYSSSVYPIRRRLYGIPDSPRFAHQRGQGDCCLREVPAATVRILGTNVPVAGGGYFRLLPYCATRRAIRRINAEMHPAMVYLHPYELEEEGGFPDGSPPGAKNRLALFTQNLGRPGIEAKLHRLLGECEFSTMKDVVGSHVEGR